MSGVGWTGEGTTVLVSNCTRSMLGLEEGTVVRVHQPNGQREVVLRVASLEGAPSDRDECYVRLVLVPTVVLAGEEAQ